MVLDKFNYIVLKFLEKYSESTGKDLDKVLEWDNDLSILKIQKLLFFLVVQEWNLMSDFKFHALPYWPVNLDTYNSYNKIKNFTIDTIKTIKKNNDTLPTIKGSFYNDVDNALESLLKYNKSIFKLSAFTLVDISHKWDCWKEKKNSRWEISQIDIIFSINYYK